MLNCNVHSKRQSFFVTFIIGKKALIEGIDLFNLILKFITPLLLLIDFERLQVGIYNIVGI